jgi:hypothetical protein
MVGRIARFDGLARARYLRLAGNVTLGLWALSWIVFGVLVGTHAASDLDSALAAVICILFAISFLLQAAARRLALRQLAELMARDDLSASRSRGLPRVR